MKFFNVKTAIAAVCVVAAGFGGVKAYNNANQTEADLLLAENVEALSSGDNDFWWELLKRGASGSAGAFVGGLASAATATVTGNPIATGAAGLAAGAAAEEGVYNGLTALEYDTPQTSKRDCQASDLGVDGRNGGNFIILRIGEQEYCEMTSEHTSCINPNTNCVINGGWEDGHGGYVGGDIREMSVEDYSNSVYATSKYPSGMRADIRYTDLHGDKYNLCTYPGTNRTFKSYAR